MFPILKGECYCPKPIGRTDILICGDKILRIADSGELNRLAEFDAVIDCNGLLAFPGMLDQHIHLIGGRQKAKCRSSKSLAVYLHRILCRTDYGRSSALPTGSGT